MVILIWFPFFDCVPTILPPQMTDYKTTPLCLMPHYIHWLNIPYWLFTCSKNSLNLSLEPVYVAITSSYFQSRQWWIQKHYWATRLWLIWYFLQNWGLCRKKRHRFESQSTRKTLPEQNCILPHEFTLINPTNKFSLSTT